MRPSVRKRIIQFGALLLFLLIGLGCLRLTVSSADSGGVVLPVLGVLACITVFLGALFALQIWLFASGGPLLAAGPYGVWVKTRPARGQAIWLPWEA